MTLTLEVTGSQGDELGRGRRKTFRGTSGSIGRVPGNDLVLPGLGVSSNHALIRCMNGTYYIEDAASTNGTFVNSTDNRLAARQPYALKSGDCIFIEAYEIQVVIENEAVVDPFAADPAALDIDHDWYEPSPKPKGDVPRAKDLPGHSAMHDPYRPPRIVQDDPAPRDGPSYGQIPTHWDESVVMPAPRPVQPGPAAEPPVRPRPPRPGPSHPVGGRPSSLRNEPPSPSPKPPVARPAGDGSLADVLEGAGLHGVEVTPELARDFGRILHVVVTGVMAVLKARQDIKDEFRMGMTTMQPKANNPLKFSANVEDALHNLLVKRNQAYLGPVEAFEDAFGDVRNHQMAMLAGMRAAFEAMLAEFDPDRLQQEFDRQNKKGALVKMPAKLRYWDQYAEKIRGMVSDADASFRALFGEEFAAAYEAQLKRLKARGRSEQS